MARQMRIALDLALISIKTVRGPVANLWCSAKNALAGTAAKPIVDNRFIEKIEDGMTRTTDFLLTKMSSLRDQQLEGEKTYLEKELDKVNRRLQQLPGSSDSSPSKQSACKSVRPSVNQAWQYAKVEMVPPMTQAFFQGAGGKSIEKLAASIADGTMSFLREQIHAIDAAAAQKKRDIEAAIKAKQEKAAAAARKAAEEKAKALAAEQAKQAEAAKAKAVAEKAKLAEAAKAKAPAEKAKTQKAEPKKEEPKKAAAAKAVETKSAVKPAVKPEAKKPEIKKPEAKKPEAKKLEAKKPEAKKPEAKKPEAKKPEAKKPDPPKKK